MKIQKLNEMNNDFKRVRSVYSQAPTGRIKTFAIISPQNPLGWKNTNEEEFAEKYLRYSREKDRYNEEQLNSLKNKLKYNSQKFVDLFKKEGDKALRISGLRYAPIDGWYDDYEKSLMIFNLALADAKVIAHSFGQESFFFGKLTEAGDKYQIGYWESSDACRTYKLIEVTETITFEDEDAENFFSRYGGHKGKGKGNGAKFRINLNYFGDELPEIKNQELFDESLDESLTFMSRASKRRKL